MNRVFSLETQSLKQTEKWGGKKPSRSLRDKIRTDGLLGFCLKTAFKDRLLKCLLSLANVQELKVFFPFPSCFQHRSLSFYTANLQPAKINIRAIEWKEKVRIYRSCTSSTELLKIIQFSSFSFFLHLV